MNITLLDVVDNKIKSEILYEERTSLGLNTKVKKKFDKVDAIDNISDYVDLGLPSGTLWCKHNYGADEEYGYGDLFNYEEAMNLDLSPGHLPSKEYFKELYDNCTHAWTHVHGIDGQMFTSKINGKKVFFPASGYRKALTFIFGRGFGGNYWSSSRYAFSSSCYAMNFNSSFVKPIDHSFASINYSVRAVISKTNESTNLGLNSKVKKKFETYVEGNDQVSEITEDVLIDLYNTWGHVPIEWQDQHFTHTLSPSDKKAIKTIASSYSKFIHDMTDGDYVCRYSDNWGQENLDAIEFWKDESSPGVKIRKTFKNKLYGEWLYWDEMKRRFYKGNENFIRDWFIPATVKLIDKHPEMKHYFFKKMRR